MSDLEQRIEKLEAESAIRKLKARYLNACDEKDPVGMRACFTENAVCDYPPLGKFNVDGLIQIFTDMAINSNIVDTHQAHNAEITVDGDQATAKWNFSYSMYDPDTKSYRLLAAFYHDKYQKTDQGWLISHTRSEPRSVVDGSLDGDVKGNWVTA